MEILESYLLAVTAQHADALSGTDRNPGAADILIRYNSDYDTGTCSGGPWHYGTAANPAIAGTLLFYPVILHDMTNGLGFASFVDKNTGSWYGGLPDVYPTLIRDATTGVRWTTMTDGERYTSIRNNLGVVIDAANTKTEADAFLTGFNVDLIVNGGSPPAAPSGTVRCSAPAGATPTG